MILLSNFEPNLNTLDKASIERTRYIPFDATFAVHPKEGEKQRDETVINDIKTKYLDEVFTLLVHSGSVKFYEDRHFNIPPCIKTAQADFLDRKDVIKQFIENRIEFTEYEHGRIPTRDISAVFKNWCKETDNSFQGISDKKLVWK